MGETTHTPGRWQHSPEKVYGVYAIDRAALRAFLANGG